MICEIGGLSMVNKNDSLLEIAIDVMSRKKKPQTLRAIIKEVFEIKGINNNKIDEMLPQFQMDFMLSGVFICPGEDKRGVKLWDLKYRQPSMILDKDGSYLEDLYFDDEDISKYELSDDTQDQDISIDSTDEDEDDDNHNQPDEIEEDLALIDDQDTTSEIMLEDEEDDDEDDDGFDPDLF